MARDIHLYLKDLPLEKVWGIGPQTTAFLTKQGIKTALDFARKSEEWIKGRLTKPHYEIWQELNGKSVLPLETAPKTTYATIQKVKTFTPASNDKAFVFAQLSKNIENATMKARRYKLAAKGAAIFIKTEDFRSVGMEIRFSRPTAFPNEIIRAVIPAFEKLFSPQHEYRQTAIGLLSLDEDKIVQLDLFDAALIVEKTRKLYESVDEVRRK